MNLVKAEILFSRKCKLHCSYCAMADGRDNSLSVAEWKKGIDNLKELNVGFVAYYGAEPLLETLKLAPVIEYTEENIGIPCTVITSGEVPNFTEHLDMLADYGLRSLTMSFDIINPDVSTSKKAGNALNGLFYFRSICKNLRDLGAVVTLTQLNYHHLYKTVKSLSKEGIRVFVDLYHWNRGHSNSKVRGNNKRLSISSECIEQVEMCLNDKDLLFHLDNRTFQTLISNDFKPKWNCANDIFPSWLTIDCDGVVYPCDDFTLRQTGKVFMITDIAQNMEEFTKHWKPLVKTVCKGCQWVTHIQAHNIKSGLMKMEDYVHER